MLWWTTGYKVAIGGLREVSQPSKNSWFSACGDTKGIESQSQSEMRLASKRSAERRA